MLKVVEMSEEQINVCLMFLSRANITGAEAEAMVFMKDILKRAVPKTPCTGNGCDEKVSDNT